MRELFTLYALAFYGLALAGIIVHAIKKWAMKEIDYSVYAYLFTVDPRGTLATVMAAMGTVIAAIGSGQLTDPHIFGNVAIAFLAGYGLDSAIYPANARGK